MQSVTYFEAQRNLNAVMDNAAVDAAPILITRRRGGNLVLVSASEWAGMEETLHLISSPANAKHLLEGIARFDTFEARSTSWFSREGQLRPVPNLLMLEA